MSTRSALAPQVLADWPSKSTALPEEDLQLVLELVDRLEESSPSNPCGRCRCGRSGRKRGKRSLLLRDVPRDQLVARFIEVGEQIRQEAVANGTAVDGDWTGD